MEFSFIYSQYVKKAAFLIAKFGQPPAMDNLESYERANIADLFKLFKSMNGLLELLVEIFYKLQLDKPTFELKDSEKKDYKKNISGPAMYVQAGFQQYMKQTYWKYGMVSQIIKLIFQDHLNYYFRSFRIANELFKRASDASKAMKIQEYQEVFEIWQMFLTQSEYIHKIRKFLSEKFNLAVN